MTKAKADELRINGKSYFITQDDRKKCMICDSDSSIVIFLYDHKYWNQLEEVRSAYVCGSFTGWIELSDFCMKNSPSLSLHYLAVPFEKLRETGNSGHPEYKFCINGLYVSLAGKDFILSPYVFPSFDKNLMVIFNGENLEEIEKQNLLAGTVKSLADFDLSSRSGQEEISNFRLVPGTKKLFRSFHPFYSTGGRCSIFETEKKRIEIAQKLAVEAEIKSDINLTDDYTLFAGNEINWYDGTCSKVEIPQFYQRIIDSKSVCNVKSASGITPSYEYVYMNPRNPLFSEWMRLIVEFIIDDAHEAPFMIHCAIGTDRTGVFSAILGAVCGADWNEVSCDYEKTNRLGILEFRSRTMLAKSFQRLLGVEDVSKIKSLKAALWKYFTSETFEGEPILTKNQLEKLSKKLGGRDSL